MTKRDFIDENAHCLQFGRVPIQNSSKRRLRSILDFFANLPLQDPDLMVDSPAFATRQGRDLQELEGLRLKIEFAEIWIELRLPKKSHDS